MYLRLPTTFAVIFGGFTLGLFVAIQGPTMMDLIDMLHVNNDIMSYSIAFASLAYSVGGLLSGFLFNYVNRQLLIAAYFCIFGLSTMITPFLSNFMIFSVINAFKFMCAGGTDCGANVWILEMWPGKDAWLQALHFAFACGCALGPLIVEPFLSVDYKENDLDKITGKLTGSAIITDQSNESRIHIPYGLSGLASISAGLYIMYLYFLNERHKKKMAKLSLKQQAAAGECILLTSVQHPAAIEAGLANVSGEHLTAAGKAELGANITPIYEQIEEEEEAEAKQDNQPELAREPDEELRQRRLSQHQQHPNNNLAQATAATQLQTTISNLQQPLLTPAGNQQEQQAQLQPHQQQQPPQPQKPPKITSKCREDQFEDGQRPPYYVMFAIALAAMCLSFYCGIEITSMNYLATFAINIDLQLTKSTAALMSSALTISFAVGRLFGIWIAVYMRPHKLFYLCASLMATGNVLMLIFANTAEMLLWYSICLFGVGCGPMFPAIVSFYDDRISKVSNTVSGIFILGSMTNVALNSVIIGHHIIDNALILIVCNLIGSVILLLLFGTLHMLTRVKRNQRIRKYKLKQEESERRQKGNNNQQQEQLLPPALPEEPQQPEATRQEKRQLELEQPAPPPQPQPPPSPQQAIAGKAN